MLNSKKSFIITLILTFLSGCATSQPVRLGQDGLSLNLERTEDKVLSESRKSEEYLEKNGALYHDVKLETYLNEIGRKIAPTHLENKDVNFQFKIIRDPTINAFAAPTGKIYLHTGLLARLQNEAQLAIVLGHEISHVINRDQVYFIDSYHKKTITAKILDLAITPGYAFIGGLNDLVGLGLGIGYVASVTGYSRELEERADKEAIKLVSKQNYDLKEGIKIFDIFLQEHEKYKRGIEIYFLSSHPSNKSRQKESNLLVENQFKNYNGQTINQEKFQALVEKIKCENALMNVAISRYYHALDNLEYLVKNQTNNPIVHYCLAEVYRTMAENPDRLKDELSSKEWEKIKDKTKEQRTTEYQNKALEEYKVALTLDKDFFDAYKGLGLLCLKTSKNEDAIYYLEKYLGLNPQAKDKRFVTAQLLKLKPADITNKEIK
ncbi:MAG: M48 family metalloprotease [Candidatus Omnitrophota bacterium]